MWTELKLPKIESKIRACSEPQRNSSIAIWTDEGLFVIRLQPSPKLIPIYTSDEAEDNFLHYQSGFEAQDLIYSMVGDCGQHGWRTINGMLTEHPHGFHVDRDENHRELRIVDASGHVHFVIDNINVQDRLQLTCFSQGYSRRIISQYFAYCDSNRLRVFEYKPLPDGAPTRWSSIASRESQELLWNAILENPDDDTPRLIYSDWLEENGDRERAEFIRLQCRIAERESQEMILPDDADFVLSQEMEKQYGERWLHERNDIVGLDSIGPFWRGFPTNQIVSSKHVVRKSQTHLMLKANPFESICLYDYYEEDTMRMLKWPLTSRWRNLTLYSIREASVANFARLFESQRLAEIRKITFGCNYGQALNNALVTNGPFLHLHTIHFEVIAPDDRNIDYSLLEDRDKLPALKNVLFFVNSDERLRVVRPDIRRLTESVDNVYRIVRQWGKPDSYSRM